MSFEQALIKEVKRIREIFADRDCSDLSFTVNASGPSMRDEIKITFTVNGTYADRAVTGANLDAVIDEFFRRRGWQKANDYLALPNITQPESSETPTDDDIPF